jgi:hypothetical protein
MNQALQNRAKRAFKNKRKSMEYRFTGHKTTYKKPKGLAYQNCLDYV